MAWSGHGKQEPHVGIVGLGYVGLPLALQFWRRGARVTGFDVDPAKVEALNAGRSYIRHIQGEDLAAARAAGRFEATADFARAAELDACCLCVPTPLGHGDEPDLSYVLRTGESLAPHLRRGQLVVLESTTYPGTTDDELRPVLERGSGLLAGRDFHLAYSPEREDPGNPKHHAGTIPKVVGGYTSACLEAAGELYARVVPQVIPVSSTRAAEATKLLENIFRCVNIALVNELKVVFDRMGLDVWEIVEAAKTKPFGFMPFYPGPGLGGHCIPIDPFYLTWKAAQYGAETKFIKLAGEINRSMPRYVLARAKDALRARGKDLRGARVLILGMAYKKDVDDLRESPSLVLWELLEQEGARVSYHDPYVPRIPVLREHPGLLGRTSVALDEQALRDADAALILTDHTAVDYRQIVTHASLVVDCRNACGRLPADLTRGKVLRA
ncbi:MAG: nucleotide sugar dehydrogenase [Planctomycetota bacterium]|nr:nucleotide sugar dehydrogenase [Planctomycetota bacterium]